MGLAKWIATAALAGSTLAGCDWLMPADYTPELVYLKGTVAVPDGPVDYAVLSQSSWLPYQWQSCPEFNNDSSHNQADGSFLLESTSNCAGAQFVYFYSDTPRDMSGFAEASLRFKIQVNNYNQAFTVTLQDADAGSSQTLDLASYGYSPGTVSIEQAITIPIADFVVPGFDLAKVSRLFQLNATCSAANCLTTLREIRWVAPAIAKAAYSSLSARQGPRCDPFACKAVPFAPVGIVRQTPLGWTVDQGVKMTVTDAQGNFTLVVNTDDVDTGEPVLIGVSDPVQGTTMLSIIPGDAIEDGADVSVDVDRTSTAVAMLTCANGMTIPADGSGGWCIGDPIGASDLDTLGAAVDGALDSTASPALEIVLTDILDDPGVLAALNTVLAEFGIAPVSAEQLAAIHLDIELPVLKIQPKPGSNTGTVGGDAQCQAAVSCEACSITACASADATSCSAWYATSDGQTYACAACDDCTAAAKNATDHCCPPPQ